MFRNAYLVGGSVRDVILGKPPLDYDIVVTGDPEVFAARIARQVDGKIVVLGKERFNLYRIISDTLSIDVTTAKGNDIESDLGERDFTINALACDLSNGVIIDSMAALDDLDNGRIKMVSPAVFRSDPVRLIRAFRMAATLNFKIEPGTLKKISHQSALIGQAAPERIWNELDLILACPDSFSTLVEMARSSLLFEVIPELRDLKGCEQNRYHTADVFEHTMRAYQTLEAQLDHPASPLSENVRRFIAQIPAQKQVLIKLAILLHDIGKPASQSRDGAGHIHFYGHAGRSASLASGICRRLRMSSRQQQWIEQVVRYHQRPLSLFLSQKDRPGRPKAVGRFLRQCGGYTPYILIHAIADNLSKSPTPASGNPAMINFLAGLLENYLVMDVSAQSPPLINGHDVMNRFHIEPSPLIGRILSNVEELRLAKSMKSKEEALEWVSRRFETEIRRGR